MVKKWCILSLFSQNLTSTYRTCFRRIYFLHTFTWVCNCFGIFFILAAHEHYSIGIYLYIYIFCPFVCLIPDFYGMVVDRLIACLFVCIRKRVNRSGPKGKVGTGDVLFDEGGGSLPSFLVQIFQIFGCTPK